MGIKTFPLQMTDDYHKKLRKAAAEADITIKEFIFKAIDKEIKSTIKED